MGVDLGVGHLLGGEGATAPVCALHTFVADYAKFVLENRGQPDPVAAQNACGQLGVVDIGAAKVEIPIQQPHVILRGVEKYLHCRVRQQFAQGLQAVKLEWIEQIVHRGHGVRRGRLGHIVADAGRNLDQADPGVVAVEAIALRVHRDQRLILQKGHHFGKFPAVLDEPGCGNRGGERTVGTGLGHEADRFLVNSYR